MVRPCFLVVDREYASSISTRKLVIETAKFNVLTAYSAQEALETFTAFPAISGAVLDSALRDIPCSEVVARMKATAPSLPIVVVRGPGATECTGADHYLDSFDPASLLELLKQMQPQKSAAIEAQNERLKREGN
jgi:CheY-like chemotaxis protein